MKLLALWAPLADYSIASLKCLVLTYNVELVLVYQPHNAIAPYEDLDLSFCKKAILWNDCDKREIENICLLFSPNVVLMSSWNYPIYMSIAKQCKKQSAYVVSTFDGQWANTIKQNIGILSSRYFLKPVIDNFFVSGDRQVTFARKLGYLNPLQGYYSANTFDINYDSTKHRLNRFVFVGRLVKAKNISNLIEAYKLYRQKVDDPWDLVICGKGELEYLCKQIEGITIMNFVQPKMLNEILLSSKCLIHPSIYEPWGLVIHEAALAGLAIICSFQTGASTAFVKDGINGFIINPDVKTLLNSMILLTQMSDTELEIMSKRSKLLGNLWSSQKWAEYVYKYICLLNT